MSFFSKVEEAPPIEVFHKNKLFMDDLSLEKVNLTIGAYRTEEGEAWVLPVVRQAEKELLSDKSLNHEYLPILGLPMFNQAAMELVLGRESIVLKEQRAFTVQTLSGTGALHLGAEFLSRILELHTVLISNPTWRNHYLVFKNANFEVVKEYRYWNYKTFEIDLDGLIDDLEMAPEKSVVVFHSCAHNPTGMDPTKEQWLKILQVVQKKKLFPFFDLAYQGFTSGDPDVDAYPIRLFAESGIELFIAQSFAKNFGLYNERVGSLTTVVKEKSFIPFIQSQMQLIIRANYSNPPAFGARIVHRILTDSNLRQQWSQNLLTMTKRIQEMRYALFCNLKEKDNAKAWTHLIKQKGMFSYTGLNSEQVNYLIQKYKIYLLSDGRINICGLNNKNVEYVANAIKDTVCKIKSHM